MLLRFIELINIHTMAYFKKKITKSNPYAFNTYKVVLNYNLQNLYEVW